MNAAACNGPDDCWFGGIGARDPTGHARRRVPPALGRDALRTVYNAGSGRAVTDLAPSARVRRDGRRSARGAVRRTRRDPPPLETQPPLLHRIAGGDVRERPVRARRPRPTAAASCWPRRGRRPLWAVGGGAASGPARRARRRRRRSRARRWPRSRRGGRSASSTLDRRDLRRRRPLRGRRRGPGTATAWAALVPFADRGRTNAKALVARHRRLDRRDAVESLPASGSGRGAAARIAFTSPTDGWMVTNAGWLFHYSDGSPRRRTPTRRSPGPIDFRPNEAAEQFVPDSAPADDSQLFAPPPVERRDRDPRGAGAGAAEGADHEHAQAQAARARRSSLSFQVTRKARDAADRQAQGRAVAKTHEQDVRPGKRSLKLKLSRKRWPNRLSFKTKELTIDDSQIADRAGDDTRQPPTTTRRQLTGRRMRCGAHGWSCVPLLAAAAAWVVLSSRGRGRRRRADARSRCSAPPTPHGADGRRGRRRLGLPRGCRARPAPPAGVELAPADGHRAAARVPALHARHPAGRSSRRRSTRRHDVARAGSEPRLGAHHAHGGGLLVGRAGAA